jgi:hypothetical protein
MEPYDYPFWENRNAGRKQKKRKKKNTKNNGLLKLLVGCTHFAQTKINDFFMEWNPNICITTTTPSGRILMEEGSRKKE